MLSALEWPGFLQELLRWRLGLNNINKATKFAKDHLMFHSASVEHCEENLQQKCTRLGLEVGGKGTTTPITIYKGWLRVHIIPIPSSEARWRMYHAITQFWSTVEGASYQNPVLTHSGECIKPLPSSVHGGGCIIPMTNSEAWWRVHQSNTKHRSMVEFAHHGLELEYVAVTEGIKQKIVLFCF